MGSVRFFQPRWFVGMGIAFLASGVFAHATPPSDPEDCAIELSASPSGIRKVSFADTWISIPPLVGVARKWDAQIVSKNRSPWLNRRVQLNLRNTIQAIELQKFVSTLEGRVESIQLQQNYKVGEKVTLRAITLRDDSGLLHLVPMVSVESVRVWGERALQTDFSQRYPKMLPRTPAALKKIQLKPVALLIRTGVFGEQRIVEGVWEGPVAGESAGVLHLNDGSRLSVDLSAIVAIALL